MSFTVPNSADAAFAAQAEPDSVDFQILVAAQAGTGVITGCAVSAQATPDMTVAVASGTITVAGTQASVTAGNVTITAADATNPRFDLVVANNSGTKSVTAGTAAAHPVFPSIPASSVVLAAVYVPAGDTAVTSTQITDKRVLLAVADGTVGSGAIADGTIVNADVNAAAAIAESKLDLASDAAAATPSRRSLGTGATQAAAGNHTHDAAGIVSGTIDRARLPTLSGVLHNLAAAAAPTVNDDSGDGYGVGSMWVDTTGDVIYQCVDATAGAAVWLPLSYDGRDYMIRMRGFLAASFDPEMATGTLSMDSGEVRTARVPISRPTTFSTITVVVKTAGSGLSYARAAVHSLDGTKLVETSSQTSSWTSTGVKDMAVASTTLPAGADVIVSVLQVGTTPAELFSAEFTGSPWSSFINRNLSSPAYRVGSLDGQSSIPSTLAGLGTGSANFFAGLS